MSVCIGHKLELIAKLGGASADLEHTFTFLQATLDGKFLELGLFDVAGAAVVQGIRIFVLGVVLFLGMEF